MILIFTYHAVCGADNRRGQDFYTVTAEQLERHFDAIARHGKQCVTISDLRAGKALPPDNFILTFDDATADHAEVVAPLLARRGWKAAFFVPTSKLNRAGYLGDDQVRALARAGHCVGFHSHEHRRLDIASDDEMREQIKRSREIIGNLIGEPPWLFAPPGGFINEHVREVALGFGVEVLRTMRWGYNQSPDRTGLETIPVNRYTDDAKFQLILQARQTRYLYLGKQAMKAFVAPRTYERLRSWLFRVSGKN